MDTKKPQPKTTRLEWVAAVLLVAVLAPLAISAVNKVIGDFRVENGCLIVSNTSVVARTIQVCVGGTESNLLIGDTSDPHVAVAYNNSDGGIVLTDNAYVRSNLIQEFNGSHGVKMFRYTATLSSGAVAVATSAGTLPLVCPPPNYVGVQRTIALRVDTTEGQRTFRVKQDGGTNNDPVAGFCWVEQSF